MNNAYKEMKYIYWSLCILLVGSFLFASCHVEDMTEEDGQTEKVTSRQAIRFSYVTPTITRGVNLDIQGSTLSAGLETGIYVRAEQPDECFHNVRAEVNGAGGLRLLTTVYYPQKTDELVSAYAYAPYQEAWGTSDRAIGNWNMKAFTVQANQSKDAAVIASDLLWAEPAGETVNPFRTEQVVQFAFRHLLTKIVVTLDIEKELITRFGTIKVEMLDVNTSCVLDLLTGNVGDASLPQTVLMAELDLSPSDFLSTESRKITKTCCAIVVPQSVTPGAALFRVTLPDGTVRIACQPEELKTEYESGKTFNYGLSLSDMVVLKDITGGEEIDLGLSVNWASHNVGAINPEDYGGLYGWADPTGVLVSTNNDSYPSANPPLEISGTDYDIAHAKWGGAWRMPTLAHFDELITRCIWTWGTYKGVWGCKITGPNGNSIFLPAGGLRLGYESQLTGVGGCYWSSTLDIKSSTGMKAVRMAFTKGDRLVFSYERYYGHSVRPVKDKE